MGKLPNRIDLKNSCKIDAVVVHKIFSNNKHCYTKTWFKAPPELFLGMMQNIHMEFCNKNWCSERRRILKEMPCLLL